MLNTAHLSQRIPIYHAHVRRNTRPSPGQPKEGWVGPENKAMECNVQNLPNVLLHVHCLLLRSVNTNPIHVWVHT